MKKKLILLLLFSVYLSSAQNKNNTLYVNMENNVFLFFKSPIVQGIPGNRNFIFESDENGKIGFIKGAKTDKTTNLLVTTEDGLMYSFILKYRAILNTNEYNHFIKKQMAINYDAIYSQEEIQENPANLKEKENSSIKASENANASENFTKTVNTVSTHKIVNDKAADSLQIVKYCKYASAKKPYYFRSVVQGNELSFQILNINYNKDLLYFSFELINKSLIDLDVEYLQFDIKSKNLKKRVSSQTIRQNPVFLYNEPKIIKGNSTNRFVAVFKKFTISKNKVFVVAIKETNGERDIEVILSPRQVLHPTNLNLKP